MVPRVGQKIGPYEILGRLGSGGMGLVFSAWDARLHRDVAIKLLKDEFLNPTMRTRFLGEARAASRLNHPNICTIFDIGEEQDSPYMVMELLKGETLRGRMQQGPLPIEAILQVATQMADALSVAHEQGIVHRDIKPANVVLVDKPNGTFQTKVLDFGLAKVDMGGMDAHTGLTTTGMTVGTVSYMSPEQARGELLDGRSDLFSLGILMYEMATRKLPFDGATSALVFVQLLNHPPEPLRNVNANLPRALEQVINTCLQKDREQRFQKAQDLVNALQKAAQTISGSEKTASWFAKLTTGVKRDDYSGNSASQEADVPASDKPSPRLLSPEEAFLRPFKPGRSSSIESKHYDPVNEAYLPEVKDQALGGEEQYGTAALSASAGEDVPVTSHASASSALESGSELSRRNESSRFQVQAPGWLAAPSEAPPHEDQATVLEDSNSWRRWRILLGSLLALALAAASVAAVLSKRHTSGVNVAPSVSIVAIANHTGDDTLGGVLAAGLELALEQSRFIGLRGESAHAAPFISDLPKKGDASFSALQRQAKAEGAATFALADIRMDGLTYSFTIHVYDAQRGQAIGECASTAATRERIVGAVDGLAINLRSVLGEDSASINNASLPLSREATSNVDALLAYNAGEISLAGDHLFDAMFAFERAVTLDPQFAQANLRLAEVYRRQHAERSASAAADHAASIVSADERIKLLSKGMQALLSAGDYQAATDSFSQITNRYPHDATGFLLLALARRQEGNFSAASDAAQQAVRLAPADRFAKDELTRSSLALGRTVEGSQSDTTSHHSDTLPSSAEQMAAFASGAIEANDPDAFAHSAEDLDAQMTHAAILDAQGQVSAGLVEWKSVAQRASATAQLTSAAAYALSQAAVDRALLGDCTTALALNVEASNYDTGARAEFQTALAAGLCGDLNFTRAKIAGLTSSYPQSFDLKAFYASDLNAVLQWKTGATADALITLQSARDYDAISPTAYLRGLVYLAESQPQPATVEFQTSLQNPRQLVLVNPVVLPMTDVSLAHAFLANGDSGNAIQAYRRAAAIMRRADPDAPVAAEAKLASGSP